MAVNKETQAAWARGRCIEQDQNGQVGRKVIELEHVRGEIKGAFFVRTQFGLVKFVFKFTMCFL